MAELPYDHLDSTGHGVNSGSDIWPRDVLCTPSARVELPWSVRVFVLSPIQGPADDSLLELIRSRVRGVAKRFRFEAEAVRVDRIVPPGSIHQSIWENLRDADIIICNLTGHNPNVIYELGVAAAYLPKTQVIVLQDRDDTAHHAIPFNLRPMQVITYGSNLTGSAEALARLDRALEVAIVRLPFNRVCVKSPDLPLGQDISLTGVDFPWLCVSHLSHRKVTAEGLEFGAPKWFQASWASYGDVDLKNLRVSAEMRFLGPYIASPEETWIGVAVRASHYYANLSHLFYVRMDRTVRRTDFRGDGAKRDSDPEVGDPFPTTLDMQNTWFRLTVEVDDHAFTYRIGTDADIGNPVTVDVAKLDYVFARGRVLVQSYNCRSMLRSIRVDEL